MDVRSSDVVIFKTEFIPVDELLVERRESTTNERLQELFFIKSIILF